MKGGNTLNKANTRSGLFAIVAIYMMKVAYDLYSARSDPDTTMTPAVRILFIVFFALAGVALLVYSVIIWNRGRKEEQQEQKKEEEENALR